MAADGEMLRDAPSRGVQVSVSAIAANPSTGYVADPRGVLQLSGAAAENEQTWSPVPAFMVAGAVPVLPG